MKKRIRKKRERTGNHIVIKIPDSLQEKYPEICDFIKGLSPKERGSLIINIFLIAGFAAKHNDIEMLMDLPEKTKMEKRKVEGIISKISEVEEI